MANRLLRFLIADPRHGVLVQVERILNELGYYRIAPVRSFNEVATLTRYAPTPIDVLITSAQLGTPAGVDMMRFCKETVQIHHSFIYEDVATHISHIQQGDCQTLRNYTSPVFDYELAKAFMGRIDASLTVGEQQYQRHPNKIVPAEKGNFRPRSPLPLILLNKAMPLHSKAIMPG